MDFDGKTAVVTGASKGIGRETAALLARNGAKVVALGRSEADLASLEKDIGCKTIIVDLADPVATRAAAKRAMPADLLVNCAGTSRHQPFVDVTEEAFEEVMTVNALAPMIISQEFAKSIIARKAKGAIVNVSSLGSLTGAPNHAGYSASKGALDAMTRIMAFELGRAGIRVNSVHPTVTVTAMSQKDWSDPAALQFLLKRTPLGRLAEPIDIASTIAFLLSEGAAMVNGIALPVDGGYLID